MAKSKSQITTPFEGCLIWVPPHSFFFFFSFSFVLLKFLYITYIPQDQFKRRSGILGGFLINVHDNIFEWIPHKNCQLSHLVTLKLPRQLDHSRLSGFKAKCHFQNLEQFSSSSHNSIQNLLLSVPTKRKYLGVFNTLI